MFLPTTKEEFRQLGWKSADIILVSGDTYIDYPYDGVAAVGKYLLMNGYKVGIIAQPEISSESNDIARLGQPNLFWGLSGGCVDSMVANYTALNKKRRKDDLTPGGENNRRPNRAVIVYTNLIRAKFKNTKPIIIGGIEASLRRIAHYDYWTDKLRRSVLFDAKADFLVYGEGERTILEIADKLKKNESLVGQRGICYISNKPVDAYLELPSFDECNKNKDSFNNMFSIFYKNNDPINAKGLYQKQTDRFLIQNPPNYYLNNKELDSLYELEFEYEAHPFYKKLGIIKALDTALFSIISHRGCYGECNFCSIAVHQGRTIRSRSEESIISEAIAFTKKKNFKGIIRDVGGATANMYSNECAIQTEKGSCKKKRCLSPEICPKMNISHNGIISILDKVRKLPGVKKVFTGSGIRYDIVVADKDNGQRYLEKIVANHISGQLKIAPEHTDDNVLKIMGKPQTASLKKFKDDFYAVNKKLGKKQYLTYYLIAAHPGCDDENMKKLADFVHNELKINPEQVQIFTPTPSTYSTAMYYTGINPLDGKVVFSEKSLKKKNKQKDIVVNE